LKQVVHHISNPDGQIVARDASSITPQSTSSARRGFAVPH
jgi:hypothetical protein